MCITTCASFCIIVRHIPPSGSKTASAAATTPRPRVYLWWNPCLLSLAFFLNCRWRRPANFLSKLHHSSQVVPAFTSSTRVRLFANSTKWMFLLEESWKWFQEAESFSGEKARGGRRGGQCPQVHGRRPIGKMLRGAGLGALRAILTQINQTAAVGPGRPQGLRPPRCESGKPGAGSTCQSGWQWCSWWGRIERVGGVRLTAPRTQHQCHRSFFQLSPPRLVFYLKTLAFGKICWEE